MQCQAKHGEESPRWRARPDFEDIEGNVRIEPLAEHLLRVHPVELRLVWRRAGEPHRAAGQGGEPGVEVRVAGYAANSIGTADLYRDAPISLVFLIKGAHRAAEKPAPEPGTLRTRNLACRAVENGPGAIADDAVLVATRISAKMVMKLDRATA